MIFLLILFTLLTICLLAWVIYKMTELDERQEELDKYSVYLDERANKLAVEENSLRSLSLAFRSEIDAFHKKDIYTASYTETDSDVMKFTTDRASAANAKNRIAMTIAHDIVKEFNAKEDLTEDGRKRFTYRFKIVEQ